MRRTIAIALAIAACKGRQESTADAPPTSSSPFVVPSVAPVTDDERKAVEDMALSYLAAMSAKDCATLVQLVAGYEMKDCKEDVEEWVEHQTQLIAIESVARDGRDPSAMLVTSKMNVGGKDRPLVIRVKRMGSDWKVHK